MRIGLTGGIGSGKSTVARLLRDHGIEVIDADQVAREVVQPGQPALAEITAHFGPDILTSDGELDRGALAGIVFNDADQRRALEAITHPAIGAETQRREQAVVSADPDAVVVVDHPLLIETDQVDDFDGLIVVLATRETRLRRLQTHRGMDPQDARARMANQVDDQQRRAVATWVIDNDGTQDQLTTAVSVVVDAIRGLVSEPATAESATAESSAPDAADPDATVADAVGTDAAVPEPPR